MEPDDWYARIILCQNDRDGHFATLCCKVYWHKYYIYDEKKDRSERYQVISRGWELCGEEIVSDNDTSGQAVRSEKMVEIQ